MRRGNRWFVSVCVSAALMAPLGVMAMPRSQDEHERHESEEHERKMYDPEYRDYHRWDSREDRMYRQWLAKRNYGYVEYDRLDPRDQRDYWKWRHREEKREHEEHEEHEHEHN